MKRFVALMTLAAWVGLGAVNLTAYAGDPMPMPTDPSPTDQGKKKPSGPKVSFSAEDQQKGDKQDEKKGGK